MMFCKLAWGNVRRSARDFALYFLTIVFGVSVFYAFNSITDQQAVLALEGQSSGLLDLLGMLIGGVSVFVAVILAFLVVYADRFLIRRRKREFAVYLTLGMQRGQLARLVALETGMIGAVSLAVGIALGVGLSQLLMHVTATFFGAEVPGFAFVFSTGALAKTLVCFLAIFAVTIVSNSGVVMRARLIDLLSASKASDDMKLRSIPLSFALFVVACAVIGFSYHLLLETGLMSLSPQFYAATVLVCAGTLLVLLLAVGLSAARGASVPSAVPARLGHVHAAAAERARELHVPVHERDLHDAVPGHHERVRRHRHLQHAHAEHRDVHELRRHRLHLLGDGRRGRRRRRLPSGHALGRLRARDGLRHGARAGGVRRAGGRCAVGGYGRALRASGLPGLHDDHLRHARRAGRHAAHGGGKRHGVPGVRGDRPCRTSRLSQYNAALELAGAEPVSLADDECMLAGDSDITLRGCATWPTRASRSTWRGRSCKVAGTVGDACIETSSIPLQSGALVVPDAALPAGLTLYRSILDVDFVDANPDAGEQFSELCAAVQDSVDERTWPLSSSLSREEVWEQNMGLTAIVGYLAVYIGFILVVASAAILAIQQLSSASDNAGPLRAAVEAGRVRASRSRRPCSCRWRCASPSRWPWRSRTRRAPSRWSPTSCQAFGHLDITAAAGMTAAAFLALYGLYFALTCVGSLALARGAK